MEMELTEYERTILDYANTAAGRLLILTQSDNEETAIRSCVEVLKLANQIEEMKRALLGPAEYELRVRGEWPDLRFDLPAGVTTLTASGLGPRFRIEDPQTANPILLREMMKRAVEVVALQELPRTLEQVYLAAMAQVRHDEGL